MRIPNSIPVAHADPPRHAPAWGHRNNRWDHNRNKRGRHDRDRYDRNRRNDRYRNDRYRDSDFRSWTGVVTKVKSSREFDVRIDGKTYNVYTDYSIPRGLDRNDVVRVIGKRVGSNDIRNARVTIIRNR